MRMQPVSREPVTEAISVVAHADRNIDGGGIKLAGQGAGDIGVKTDLRHVAIDQNSDPSSSEPVEADRPHPRFSSLKKSLPLSSMMMKAGKSTTSMRQIASMPSSGYSTTSTFLMQCSARFAAAPPIEPR